MRSISINYRLTSKIALLLFCAACTRAQADVIGVHLDDEHDGPRQNSVEDDNIVGLMDPVLRLNRYTFQNTILKEQDNEIPNWIVLFCTSWLEPCHAMDAWYRQLANKWEGQLNKGLFTSTVRFAAVDCTTEKALCNTQNVDTYPFAAYYRHRKQVDVWAGRGDETYEQNGQRFQNFLQEALSRADQTMSEDEEDEAEDVAAHDRRRIAGGSLLIFAAIAVNTWLWLDGRGGFSPGMSSSGSAPASPPAGFSSCENIAVVHNSTASVSPQADLQASCTLRALPKEWALERPSLEL